MAGWGSPLELLREELVQRRWDGCGVPDDLAARIAALPAERQWDEQAVGPLYQELVQLPGDAGLETNEPNDLDAIRALRPAEPQALHWGLSTDQLLDRIHGAWTARAAGCALGKPVEELSLGLGPGEGRLAIRRLLEASGDWPLSDYFSAAAAGPGLELGSPRSQRENVIEMEPDDDIHYTLAALGVLEWKGLDFDWRDVATWWLAHIPTLYICTAEAQAVLNLQQVTRRGLGGAPTPEFTRGHRNPYREWIGAQIRADGWAWACAGNPELAAELAWRDARWTHERNGIYAEMFMAAMQAAAFVLDEPTAIIEAGLSQVPRDSRLAVAVRDLLSAMTGLTGWEQAMAWVEARYPDMSAVHSVNNALACVVALVHGAMDPVRSITTAVMCGLDTDCNGASVGSIVGAAVGRSRLSGTLFERLNDRVRAAVTGFDDVTMTELAQRTAAHWWGRR